MYPQNDTLKITGVCSVYIQIFKLGTFKDVNASLYVQSRKLILFEEALLVFEAQDSKVE